MDLPEKGVGRLLLLECLFLLAVVSAGEDVTSCTKDDSEICKDDPNCIKDTPLLCYHGGCEDDGSCRCDPCWTGKHCNISANLYPPMTDGNTYFEVSLPEDYPRSEVFMNIATSDLDDDDRCARQPCPCAETTFTIAEDGNSHGLIGVETIDRGGAFFLMEEGELTAGEIVGLTVILENVDGLQSSEVILAIFVTPPAGYDDDANVVIKRRRRAAPEVLDINDTLAFSLEVLNPSPSNLSNITVGTHVDIQVTILIPPGVLVPSLNLEFFAETENDTAFAVVCEPGVRATGSFVTYAGAAPSLSFDALNYFQADTAHLELTDVTNTNNETEYEISLEVGLTIIASGGYAKDELSWISIGAEFLDLSRVWVGQVGFYIDPSVEEPVATSPVLVINGSKSINKGESGAITLQMNIYEPAYTLSVVARVTAPVNSPGYHICKFGLRTTGGGYCLENQVPTQMFTSDPATGFNEGASFDFKEVIYGGEDGDAEASLILMDLFVFLPDDGSVLPGESYDVHFDVVIDGVTTTTTDTFTAEGNVTPTEAVLLPSFAMTLPGISSPVSYAPNELLQLEAVLSFPVGNYQDVKIRSEVAGQPGVTIPLLDANILDVGYNVGCMTTCTSFLPKVECSPANRIWTFAQAVTNRGLRCWEGDNDIRLRLLLRVEDLPVGGPYTLSVTLAVGAFAQATADFDLNVQDRITAPPQLPGVTSSIDGDLYIAVGSNVTHNVTIVFEPNTEFTYDFMVTSDVDWMTVNSITLAHIGKDIVADLSNLVLADSFVGGEYNATVTLGYLNNIATFQNETSAEKSSISFEVNFGFREGHSVADLATASMGLQVIASDGAPVATTDSVELPFTVIAVNDTTDDIKTKIEMDCPSDVISPGAVISCSIMVNFTDRRDFLVFEVDASSNGTSEMPLTVEAVNVASLGQNIQATEAPGITYTSSMNTSQLDHGRADFGYLINSANSSDPMDDRITVEIRIRATDAAENVNGTELLFGVGASVGDKMVWVAYWSLTMARTGDESADLSYSTSIVESGNSLEYDLTIRHNPPSSSLEPRTLSATLYLPPYLTYVTSHSDTDHTIAATGNKLMFVLPHLLFVDIFAVRVTLSRNCDHTLSFKEHWKATTILGVEYQTYSRDSEGAVTPPGALSDVTKEPLQPLVTQFSVSRMTASAGKPPTCLSPVPLGMESGKIADCQITSSQGHDSTDNPYDGRRNGISAWKVGKSGPMAGKRWMKIDIGRLSALTMIQTQGGSGQDFEGDIGEYEVFYSTDDVVYRRGYHLNDTGVNSVFDHRRTYSDPVPANYVDIHTTHFLVHPVEARFVIIRMLEDTGSDDRIYNALRVELYGCTMEPEQSDKCENRTASVEYERLPEEYDRGFTVDTGTNTLYVCTVEVTTNSDLVDGPKEDIFLFKPGKKSVRCFKTTDTYNWQSLGNNIRSVIGYSPSTAGVYAIAGSSQPAYVVSIDGGLQWAEVTVDELNVVRSAPDYVPYQELPMEPGPGFNHVNSTDVHSSIGDWKATFDGMIGPRGGSPQRILDWNRCCKVDE